MQVVKKETHIRVSIENKGFLEEKKRKLRLNSIDEVISMLLQKEEEFSIIKKVENRKKADTTSILKEKPKMELPLFNGKCLFKAEQYGKINCAKNYFETDIIHSLTIEQCNECWNNAIHVPISKQ